MDKQYITDTFNTMLDVGRQTALKFAKPYFIHTFEWYTNEDFNVLNDIINNNINKLIVLNELSITQQRDLEVLKHLKDYVSKQTPILNDNEYIPSTDNDFVDIDKQQQITRIVEEKFQSLKDKRDENKQQCIKNLEQCLKEFRVIQTKIEGLLYMLRGCDKQ